MRWLVTRPNPDGQILAQRLGEMGHTSVISPLIHLAPRPIEPIDWPRFGAIIFTSRNGVKQGAPFPPQALKLPVFAVGDATAQAARTAGFDAVISAGGNVDDLISCLQANLTRKGQPVLHFCGQDSAGDPASALASLGISLLRVVVYEMQPATSLTAEALRCFGANELNGAIFLSPRTAEIFTRLAASAAIVPLPDDFVFAVISPATARQLTTHSNPGGQIKVAARPDLDSVLALVE